MTYETKTRISSVEGLRGLAAIVVVIFHIIYMFYPMAVEGSGYIQHSWFETVIFGSPFFGFFSGVLAVSVFFVLSGFVLSVKYFESRNEQLVRQQAFGRYIRLALPALVSVVIAYFILITGIGVNAWAGTSTNFIGQWNVVPNFFSAVFEGLIGIFMNSSSKYNAVLWTMYYEFLGSMLVFGFLLLFGKNSKRWLVYMLALLLFNNTFFLGFWIGIMIADVLASEKMPKLNPVSGVALLLAGIMIGGVSLHIAPGSFYSFFPTFMNNETQKIQSLRTIGASLIVLSVIASPLISKLFSSRWLCGLGKYTFSLYLVHKMILFTIIGRVFIYLSRFMGYNKAVLLSVLVGLPFLILATMLFEKIIDRPSIKLAKQLSQTS